MTFKEWRKKHINKGLIWYENPYFYEQLQYPWESAYEIRTKEIIKIIKKYIKETAKLSSQAGHYEDESYELLLELLSEIKKENK